MKKKIFILTMVFIFMMGVIVSGATAATIDLFDWAFNVNGTVYPSSGGSSSLPGTFNSSFDWTTGLGTITVNGFGVGANSFHAFFDHEIDEGVNTFFNEYGDVSGTPATGQSWEIDEPGYVFGDIYTHLLAGSLDNSNAIPLGSDPSSPPDGVIGDDVSMAMGWGFSLNPGETASISLVLGTTRPTSGFYLSQTDPDSPATIYFSSNLDIRSASVPEPGTMLLMGTGLTGLIALRRRLKK